MPGDVFSPALATRRSAWGKVDLFESVAPALEMYFISVFMISHGDILLNEIG